MGRRVSNDAKLNRVEEVLNEVNINDLFKC